MVLPLLGLGGYTGIAGIGTLVMQLSMLGPTQPVGAEGGAYRVHSSAYDYVYTLLFVQLHVCTKHSHSLIHNANESHTFAS